MVSWLFPNRDSLGLLTLKAVGRHRVPGRWDGRGASRCLGGDSAVSRRCLGGASVVSRWCLGGFLVVSW